MAGVTVLAEGQIEERSMELWEYWVILRRWLWLVILGTGLAAGSAYVVSANTQPVYRSTVTMRLDPATGRLSSEYAGLLVADQLAGTYSQQIKMRPVMEATLEALGLEDRISPGALSGMVTVTPVRDTQLIRVSVEHTDPVMAADIANQIVAVFIDQNQRFEQGRYADLKASLSKQLNLMQQELEVTQAAIDGLGTPPTVEDQAELERLNLTRSSQQAAYSNLLSNFEEIRIAEASESSNIVVAEEAIPYYSPVRPRTRTNTMLAAGLGAAIAIGIGFLIEYLDDTVKSPEDVTSIVDMPTLGVISQIEGRTSKERLITRVAPRSPVSEAYRALRTNIQFASVDGPLKSIMVTSAGPSEGKSTTAANLAVVLAQAGKQVILVDADLRRPIQHRFFELPNSRGLTTALLDLGAPVGEHIQDTSVPGLRLMTSSAIPPNPAELLGSQRQADLLAALQDEADIVVVDSPPVLTVTDALIMASRMSGVLLVVEAGATRRAGLLKAMDALMHADGRVLGVTLNRMTRRRSGYYYYQYYQYYYSRYQDEDRASRRRHLLPGLRR
jgi:succinoglycan biosynthesis transport protein ExoP